MILRDLTVCDYFSLHLHVLSIMSSEAVTIVRASRSAEELSFLSQIVDNPTDEVNRLVYADWLDEHDDARGLFLRNFVEAYRSDKPIPDLDGLPQPWLDLTGLTITSKIVESGLRKWRDELISLARPALRIEASEANFDDPPPTPALLGTTRLGGDPDLPANIIFPTAADGLPLHFLGQFNLVDFRNTVAGQYFPDSGLLSIFRPESDGKNCYPSSADCPNLVQLIARESPLKRLERPKQMGETALDRMAPFRPGLRLVETLRLPESLLKWPGVSLVWEQYSKLDDALNSANVAGAAYLLLGHVVHGNIGEEPLKDRPDWVQLLLVPYFEGPDYGISDMSLSYQLPAADLKAGRFDRLEATFG